MRKRTYAALSLCALLTHAIGGCITDPGSDASNISEDGDLKVVATFEAESQQILVSFIEPLERGQSLFVAVRRGDLGAASWHDKDCGKVADEAIAIFGDGAVSSTALSDASAEAHAGRDRIYRLPLADPTLLTHPYSDSSLPDGQSWADGIDTPEKDAILKQGVDTFIDICVTQDGVGFRREQIDLYLAMDLDNPHIVRDSLAGSFDHDQPRITSPQKYGETCVGAMGEIPFFKNKRQSGVDGSGRPQYTYDTWSCLDSVHIPVTVTAADADGQETTTYPDWDNRAGNASTQCDKRQYIYPLCEQGPRVISAVNEQGTHWVLLCRKVVGTTPKLVQVGVDENGEPILVDKRSPDELSSRFNDVAMVGHNPRTGRTCFFQNALGSRYDGSRVAHPADIEKSKDTDDRQAYLWSGVHGAQGGINCNNCHDSDPFIVTPWLAGAKRDHIYEAAQKQMSGEGANGWARDTAGPPQSPVVPMIGVHGDFPLRDKTAPYTLVNFAGQGWTHAKQLVGPEVSGCNKCHRIGAGNTLKKWATRSVGLDDNYNKMITQPFLDDWKRIHFMPFDPAAGAIDPLPGPEEWADSEYGIAIDHIQQCKNANQGGSDDRCKFSVIPREAQHIDVDPNECWSDIPDDCDF